jgi:hypothetical protein
MPETAVPRYLRVTGDRRPGNEDRRPKTGDRSFVLRPPSISPPQILYRKLMLFTTVVYGMV